MYRRPEVIGERYGQEKCDKDCYEAENEKQSYREVTYIDKVKRGQIRHNRLQYKLTHNQKNDGQEEHKGHVECKRCGDQPRF